MCIGASIFMNHVKSDLFKCYVGNWMEYAKRFLEFYEIGLLFVHFKGKEYIVSTNYKPVLRQKRKLMVPNSKIDGFGVEI